MQIRTIKEVNDKLVLNIMDCLPWILPSVVGTKEKRKEGGSKGNFVCVLRSSTNFKTLALTFIAKKDKIKENKWVIGLYSC